MAPTNISKCKYWGKNEGVKATSKPICAEAHPDKQECICYQTELLINYLPTFSTSRGSIDRDETTVEYICLHLLGEVREEYQIRCEIKPLYSVVGFPSDFQYAMLTKLSRLAKKNIVTCLIPTSLRTQKDFAVCVSKFLRYVCHQKDHSVLCCMG